MVPHYSRLQFWSGSFFYYLLINKMYLGLHVRRWHSVVEWLMICWLVSVRFQFNTTFIHSHAAIVALLCVWWHDKYSIKIIWHLGRSTVLMVSHCTIQSDSLSTQVYSRLLVIYTDIRQTHFLKDLSNLTINTWW